MNARFVTLATFTETATPTPVPLSLVVAEPSAVACPSALAMDCTVNAPPDVMWRASGTDAIDEAFSMSIATAPATLTPPSDVPAEGEVAPLLPWAVPPLELALLWAVVSAKLFWSFVLPSTCLPDESVFSSLAPLTLALAVLSLPEIAADMKAEAPPVATRRSRPVVAAEESLTIVSATEMPTPVFDDLVSPLAFV